MKDNIKQHDWGYEIAWVTKDTYYSKIIAFNKPARTSMSFHKLRNKSWFINDGQFKIRWIDTKTGQAYESELKEGLTFDVPALMPISIECISPTGSFTEVGDVSKTDDAYHLSPTGVANDSTP